MLPLASKAMLVAYSLPLPPKRFAQIGTPAEFNLTRNKSWPPTLLSAPVPLPKSMDAAKYPARKILPALSTATAWPVSEERPPNLFAHIFVGRGALLTVTATLGELFQFPARS